MAPPSMREVFEIRDLPQAKALLHPVRIELLKLLGHERTCRELAERLELSQQLVNHHLKELLRLELIEISRSNQKANLLEAVYRRVGKAYWFSPQLVRGDVSSEELRERLSLHNLLVMAETLQSDVVTLL